MCASASALQSFVSASALQSFVPQTIWYYTTASMCALDIEYQALITKADMSTIQHSCNSDLGLHDEVILPSIL